MSDNYEEEDLDMNQINTENTKPTMKAVITARERIRRWLNPNGDEFAVFGNVTDHASKTVEIT